MSWVVGQEGLYCERSCGKWRCSSSLAQRLRESESRYLDQAVDRPFVENPLYHLTDDEVLHALGIEIAVVPDASSISEQRVETTKAVGSR